MFLPILFAISVVLTFICIAVFVLVALSGDRDSASAVTLAGLASLLGTASFATGLGIFAYSVFAAVFAP